MSIRNWTFEDMDYFVALYRQHECLWNQTGSGTNKDNAYADIQAKVFIVRNFNLEVEEIKRKILSLRELYKDLKKKYNGRPPQPKTSTWFKDMEYVMIMTYDGSELTDETSGEPLKSTKPISTTEENDDINSPLKLFECKKTILEEVIISDDEEELTVVNDAPVMSTIKESARIMILEILKKLYSDKAAIDYPNLMDAVSKIANDNNDIAVNNLKSFVNNINSLGFIQKKTTCGRTIIVEKADQRFDRYIYLTKMRTARSKPNRHNIVYIDERIIGPKFALEKVNSVMRDLPDETIIYYHALTRDGLINGIFSNQATEEEFIKWVSTILMSYLNLPSLIIMDRGPLHGALEDSNPITEYSSKSEMLKWLIDNNIPFNRNMPRPVLFELIRKYRNVNKEYKIDKILKSHGHKVLRLPYTFPDLNLTYLFWDAVSKSISMSTNTKPKTLDQIMESVNSISKHKKKISDMEKVLILKENQIHQIDIHIETRLENYVFKK